MDHVKPASFAPAFPLDAMAQLTYTVYARLEECEDAWRVLEEAGGGRAFQSFAWMRAWCAAFASRGVIEPRIVVGRRGGEPSLLVPLAIERRLGARVLTWLGGSWNDYNGPLVAPDLLLPTDAVQVAALWREIAALAGPADLIELEKEAPCLGSGRANPLRHPATTPEDNCAYALDLTPDMAAGPLRGGRTLSGLDRKLRKLARDGEVRFTCFSPGPEAAQAVARMLAWKERMLHARGASNPFADPASRTFLTAVAADATSRARVHGVLFRGEPIAVALCLLERDELVLYQTAYDERFARASAGGHLLAHLIRTAAAEGFRTLDFTFGDDAYKTDICNRRTTLTRALVPLSPLGHVVAVGSRARLGIRRMVKGNEGLYRTALRLNGAYRSWREGAAPTPRANEG